MAQSQSEMSQSLMHAVDVPITSGFNNQNNNNHNGDRPSVFNRVILNNNVGRENAFSVSGQKVVHFKDTAGVEVLSEDRK